jgi:predicted nucleic acid-binding protein
MGLGSLQNIPYDEKVFIDSNILTYNLLNDSVYGSECNNFINGIEEERYYGFVSPLVISETLFNVIKAWAFREHGVRPRDLIRVVKERPNILHDVPIDQASELFDLFFVLSIGEAEVKESYKLINKYYLLTNDALNAATMKVNRISNMATNDRDFFNIDWIKCWQPDPQNMQKR